MHHSQIFFSADTEVYIQLSKILSHSCTLRVVEHTDTLHWRKTMLLFTDIYTDFPWTGCCKAALRYTLPFLTFCFATGLGASSEGLGVSSESLTLGLTAGSGTG